jgi:hypothetical protein
MPSNEDLTHLGIKSEFAHVGGSAGVHLLVDPEARQYAGKQILNSNKEQEQQFLMHETAVFRRLPQPQHALVRMHGVTQLRFDEGQLKRLLVQDYASGPDGSVFTSYFHGALASPDIIRAGEEWQPVMLYASDLIRSVDSISKPGLKRGVVHGDLKPQNVRFWQGRVVVFDLGDWNEVGGIARTRTDGYAAPETKRLDERTAGDFWIPETVDARTDLFSIAHMVEEMVLNCHPLDRPSDRRPKGRLANDVRKVAEYKDLLAKLQAPRMQDRLMPDQALRHPFFRGLDVDLAVKVGRAVVKDGRAKDR